MSERVPPSGRAGVIPKDWASELRTGMSADEVRQRLGPPLLRLGAETRKVPPAFREATDRHDWKWPGGAGLREAWFYILDRRGRSRLRHRADLVVEFGAEGVRWSCIQEFEGEAPGLPADVGMIEGTTEGLASPKRAKPPAKARTPVGPLSVDELRVVRGPALPVSPAEVDEVEAWLGCRLPVGYREFVTRFGSGVLCGFLRVYTPGELRRGERSVGEWRARLEEFWLWDDDPDRLTRPRGLECVRVADTVNGDEFVFHPSEPDRVLVLGRADFRVYDAGRGLLAALDWALGSETLTGRIRSRTFEPIVPESSGA